MPLSYAQRQLWLHEQLDPARAIYNVPIALRLRGEFDPAAWAGALARVIARHETLRTRIISDQGVPVSIVEPVVTLPPRHVALDALAPAAREAEAFRLAHDEACRPFALDAAPLLRARLVQLGPREWIVSVTTHHLVCDGWSVAVLLDDLAAAYRAHQAQVEPAWPPLTVQYSDYVCWQRDWLDHEATRQRIEEWCARSREMTALRLLSDHPRATRPTYQGGICPIELDAQLTADLRQFALRRHLTPFMTLLGIFAALLARYSGQTAMRIGCPLAGRVRPELEPLVGLFANTVAIDLIVDPEAEAERLFAHVRDRTVQALDFQDVPIDLLIEALRLPRQAGTHPLFQAIFSLQNAPAPGLGLRDAQVQRQSTGVNLVRFDLELQFHESRDRVSGMLGYSRDLFEPETAARMAGHFVSLLRGCLREPQKRLGDLPLATAAEEAALRQWNDTRRDLSSYRSTREWFETQAARTPSALAVEHGQTTMTYADLDRRAHAIAHGLIAVGVRPGEPVACALPRGCDQVAALLGIWKAGAIYVPIDPTQPRERLALLLSDSDQQAVLTSSTYVDQLETSTPCLCVEAISPAGAARALRPNAPHDLAYIIYTSGTTGIPKGVAVEHEQLLATLTGSQAIYRFDARDRIPVVVSPTFDVYLFEVFAALLTGGTAVILEPADLLDPDRTLACLSGVTFLHAPATMLHRVLENLRLRAPAARLQARTIAVGGEAVSPRLLAAIRERVPGARVHVGYGPTEATIMCTNFLVPADIPERRLIGQPMANVTISIRDARGLPVPVGVPGEIWIGGLGVARGYWRRDDLTRAQFVQTPDGRFYKSGDGGRWLASGEIEFLGRQDGQVKLRGYRIELAEIERALATHPAISAAAVVVDGESPEQQRLVAYVVASAPEGMPDPGQLREYLRMRLPAYMVPAVIAPLDTLPLTAHGKLDRAALPPIPEVSLIASTVSTAADTSDLLMSLAAIWAEVLRVPRAEVDAETDFFAAGGHSLLAVQMLARLQDQWQIRVPLRALFEASRFEDFGRVIARARDEQSSVATSTAPASQAPAQGPIPLSFQQESLWILEQINPGGSAYNLVTALRLAGTLDEGVLLRALSDLVARHDVLQARITVVDRQPWQEIAADRAPFTLVDLSTLDAARAETCAAGLAAAESARPFVLSRGPLCRGMLLRLAPDRHAIVLTLHHLVFDGWSLSILLQEVATLYDAYLAGRPSPLPPASQYADYARAQRAAMTPDRLATLSTFWRSHLADVPPVVEFRADRPRPAVRTFRGATHWATVPTDVAARIREAARQAKATPFVVCAAALAGVLHHATGHDRIVLGTGVASRPTRALQQLVGLLVNQLAVAIDCAGDPTGPELVTRVRDAMLACQEHQDLPFHRLLDLVRPPRQAGRTPLFQVKIVMQNLPLAAIGSATLSLSPLGFENRTAKFDTLFNILERPDGFAVVLEYNADLYTADAAARIGRAFLASLEAVTQPDPITLRDLRQLLDAHAAQQATDAGRAFQSALRARVAARQRR